MNQSGIKFLFFQCFPSSPEQSRGRLLVYHFVKAYVLQFGRHWRGFDIYTTQIKNYEVQSIYVITSPTTAGFTWRYYKETLVSRVFPSGAEKIKLRYIVVGQFVKHNFSSAKTPVRVSGWLLSYIEKDCVQPVHVINPLTT